MELLISKSTKKIINKYPTVGNNVTLPNGERVLISSKRPLDLGEYELVLASSLPKVTKPISAKEAICNEINRLEALETPTKLAEAVLTDDGKTWLQSNRDLIQTELDKL